MMAGDWIKMRIGLREDPAVVSMALSLGADQDLVVGKLHRIWGWADIQTKDGRAAGITAAWIDRFVGRKSFAKAMCDVGWLIISDTGIEFPRFDRHNGASAKQRADAAERQRASRQVRDKSVTNVTKPCDKSVTREEKRREELNNTTTGVTKNGGDCDIRDAIQRFVTLWNSTPGTKPCDEIAISQRTHAVFERFTDPAWMEIYPKALAKFPLQLFASKVDPLVTASWFLQEETVMKILDGSYDFTPTTDRSGKPIKGPSAIDRIDRLQ